MRRVDKQVTDPYDIESILRKGQLCFLAMVDVNRPYIVPVCYGYEDEALYIHSAPEGRKIDILRRNPVVCFSIVSCSELRPDQKACNWSAKYNSVVGTGKAGILTNREAKEFGLRILMGQYSKEKYDFSGVKLDEIVIIRIEIEEMEGKEST
jgi:nitroimidazol reductase NimA-like FMN-containing flavoprotein (pyridoxamine 5'-phosphate oxidase superfamily)